MTRDAQRWVLRPHPRRVEARSMRIEVKARPNRGMTGRAVAFGVAGCARLQALPRGLTVSEAEPAERVVVTGAADPR